MPDATPNFDWEYDAVKIMATSNDIPQIYSLIAGSTTCTDMLAINTLPLTQRQPVPLGFSTSVPGNYTITAVEIDGLKGVKLEDKVTGTFTDLASSSHSFSFNGGEADTRFILHFSPLGIDDQKQGFVKIYSFEDQVCVVMKGYENGLLFVYNLMGELVVSHPVSQGLNEFKVATAAGTCIVKVATAGNAMVKKVFLRQ